MTKKGLKRRKSRNSSNRSQICAKSIDKAKKIQKEAVNSGKEEENKGMQKSQKMQVDMCDICGHSGFINALMYCSVCSDISVHQYCLGIPPGSIDDTFDWICEYCSPSEESGHYNSSAKESVEELVPAFEMETEQYENEIILTEEELEPLCILPPLFHQDEHHTQDADVIPNIASTHRGNSMEEHESTVSSFIHRSMSCCDGSHVQHAEGIFAFGLLDHRLKDREESEAPVSSFMESPKEIMRGLVLLVRPSGDVIIERGTSFCGCLAMPTVNMTNSCNEMNSLKQVDKPSGFSHASDVACPEKVSEDADVREDTIMVHPGSSNQIKCKRTAAMAKFNLIPSLGFQCKKARSKRSKLVSSLNKELGACEVTVSGVSSIGKERSVQPMNALNADMLRKTHHGTCQTDTFINNPLTSNNLHTELIDNNCVLFTGLVDVCGNKTKERAAQVDDRLYDQGLNTHDLSSDNVYASEVGSNTCGKQNEELFPFARRKLGRRIRRIEYLSSSLRFTQDHSYIHRLERHKNNMEKSPPCDEEAFQRDVDSEKYNVDGNAIKSKEVSCSMDHAPSFSKSLQGQSSFVSNDLSSQMLTSNTYQILCNEHVNTEKVRDELDVNNCTMRAKESNKKVNLDNADDAGKEYDFELNKKVNLDNEKNKLEEVVKKNRRRMWKVVYELETTKKELQEKMVELAKKETEVEMAKELATKKDDAFIPNKKEAYDFWLDGYSSAESVIYKLHPELN